MNGIEMPQFMKSRAFKVIKWIIIVALGFSVLLVIANAVLSRYAVRKLQTELTKVGGKVTDVHINLFVQSVSFDELELNIKGDSLDKSAFTAKIAKLRAGSISLYDLLIRNSITIGELSIADGAIMFDRAVDVPKDSSSGGPNLPESLTIEELKLNNIKVDIMDDTTREFTGFIHATLSGFQSSDTADLDELKSYALKDFDITVNKILLAPSKLYQLKIANVNARSINNSLIIDSITLVPQYSKYRFAEVAGKQTDRVNTFIKKIEATELRYKHLPDSTFMASRIAITAGEVYSFRDKRRPFRETKIKPLPMAALREIGFDVEVDTITIADSKVTYEEYPEDGFGSGKITFEDLNATLTNLNSRLYENKPDHATLEARAKLMGQAVIDAKFQLPINDDKPYYAEGKISKMPLKILNPVLQELAFVRIESGTLNGIDFNFNYNDRVSSGTVIINYEDLKVEGLKKEKKTSKNDLKTFLLNTIVKNDKDKSVPTEKRSGKIEFERDRYRQIFNYWWKSLFSGIKSSVLET